MNKKKILIILYAAGMLVFLLWMAFSSSLLIQKSGYKVPSKIDFSTLKQMATKDPVYYALDSVQIMGDDMESFSFAGWSFVETEEENPERHISLILRGDTESYEMPMTAVIPRPDLPTTFPERKIMGESLGFSGEYATLKMPNGTYDIYLYCWENDTNYGLVSTGYVLEKEGQELTYGPGSSEQVAIPQTTETKELRSVVDSVAVEEARVKIVGWALVPDLDTETQTVYVSLTSADGDTLQYTTKEISRPDVAEAFGDGRYENRGFQAVIPVEEVADGTYTLQILVENGGEVWSSAPVELVKSGDSAACSQ